jgi:succinate-semialdehyde dehydrogenase/glutarate-semialdehyde dehydrogenase
LTAVAVHQLAIEAGIPEDVFQLVTSSRDTTPEVGEEFCTNPLVKKVSFTGSTSVGKLLMQQCSGTVKRLSLELGGNAPFVVFADADIDQAVSAAVASKYRNAGQTCVCADRFLVHTDVHDQFVEKLVERIQSQIVVGHGLDPSTTMGPLITRAAVDQVHSKVREALELGARLGTGGSVLDRIGLQFYAPTVLTDVPISARIWSTETFGPVAAIVRFNSDDEALRIANDSQVGLASYFCTRDLHRAFSFAKSLEAGLVGVNEGIMSTALAPFGGVKESGLGREGSTMGIQEYLETKYVFMNY